MTHVVIMQHDTKTSTTHTKNLSLKNMPLCVILCYSYLYFIASNVVLLMMPLIKHFVCLATSTFVNTSPPFCQTKHCCDVGCENQFCEIQNNHLDKTHYQNGCKRLLVRLKSAVGLWISKNDVLINAVTFRTE